MFVPAKKNPDLPPVVRPEVLYMPPGTGKTTRLIEESHRTGYTMVVRSMACGDQIAREAAAKGLHIPPPISFSTFVRQDWLGMRITGFLIDDVQDLLKHIAGAKTVAMIAIRNMNDRGTFFPDCDKPPEEDTRSADEFPPTGTMCSVCNMPQYATPYGDCCKNGHGGAPPSPDWENV